MYTCSRISVHPLGTETQCWCPHVADLASADWEFSLEALSFPCSWCHINYSPTYICLRITRVQVKKSNTWASVSRDSDLVPCKINELIDKPLMLGKTEGNRWRGQQRWDGWIALPTAIQWTWTWANFRRQWGTGRPGVLQSTGSQRVRPNLATEQQQQQKWGEF